jgi:hypothetical protein
MDELLPFFSVDLPGEAPVSIGQDLHLPNPTTVLIYADVVKHFGVNVFWVIHPPDIPSKGLQS